MVDIIEDLATHRLLQKCWGEGPNARFDLPAEVGRAVGMGSLGNRRHSKKIQHEEFYLKTSLESDSELKHHKWQWIRARQDCYTQITTVESRQHSINESTFANLPF
jgi:hypothetical protein